MIFLSFYIRHQSSIVLTKDDLAQGFHIPRVTPFSREVTC